MLGTAPAASTINKNTTTNRADERSGRQAGSADPEADRRNRTHLRQEKLQERLAKPPVCGRGDGGRFCHETENEDKKARASKSHQRQRAVEGGHTFPGVRQRTLAHPGPAWKSVRAANLSREELIGATSRGPRP